MKYVSGWGNYPLEPSELYIPNDINELKKIIETSNQEHLIARGLGRSYGDTAINLNNGIILFDLLKKVHSFENGILECDAGMSFEEILEYCIPKGYFLPVTPGTKFVTVGGAIANNVHGKNHHKNGCISAHVLSFDLLIASGEIITCSRENNSELFWATVGGIGLTGMILKAKIQMIPITTSFIKVEYRKANNVYEALEMFESGDDNYQYSVAWIDLVSTGKNLGRSVLMRGNHAKADDLSEKQKKNQLFVNEKGKLTVPFYLPGFVLNSASIKLFNTAYYAKYKNETKIENYDNFYYPLDAINNWNKGYGKKGFLQYQMALPFGKGKDGLIELLKTISDYKKAFLAVLKTFGKQDEGYLSFPFEGYTLALDIPIKGNETFALCKELDKIVLRYGGRTNLSKDAQMTKEIFAKMYPRLDEFRKIKNEVDPNNIFSSSMSRRLGI